MSHCDICMWGHGVWRWKTHEAFLCLKDVEAQWCSQGDLLAVAGMERHGLPAESACTSIMRNALVKFYNVQGEHIYTLETPAQVGSKYNEEYKRGNQKIKWLKINITITIRLLVFQCSSIKMTISLAGVHQIGLQWELIMILFRIINSRNII